MDKQVKIDRLRKQVKLNGGEIVFNDNECYDNVSIVRITDEYVEIKYKNWRKLIKIFYKDVNDKILNCAERKISRNFYQKNLAA